MFNDHNDSNVSEEDEEDEEDNEGDEDQTDEEFANPDEVNVNDDQEGEDEDIDSEAAFGESDAEKFSKFTFRGSSHPATNRVKKRPTASDFMSDSDNQDGTGSEEDETDEDILDVDEQHSEEEDEENSASDDESDVGDESENEQDHDRNEKTSRDELRKIMNEEQSTVVATISQAAKDDANKGNAVRRQRKAFDSLLNVRIALQKALISTNSMAAVEEGETETAQDEPYQAAEDAALKLWNTLDGIRHELIHASTANGSTTPQPGSKKRKRPISTSTTSQAIWERMQDSEVSSLDNRRLVLEKWWTKVKGSTPSTASSSGKLLSQAQQTQSITSALQDHLSKPTPLESTRRPRSCAPIQEKRKVLADEAIYDDTGFYKLLLNQLVEQRKVEAGAGGGMAATTTAQWAVKEAKMRKVVDTKASKGRKLRYTVHEKLQNFMAPEERGTWEVEAVDRFFGSLFGKKMTLGEGEDVDMEGAGDAAEDITPEEEGLRLFRS